MSWDTPSRGMLFVSKDPNSSISRAQSGDGYLDVCGFICIDFGKRKGIGVFGEAADGSVHEHIQKIDVLNAIGMAAHSFLIDLIVSLLT